MMRAQVGTIYKQVCPFTARKTGAALVAKNISQHLIEHFASKKGLPTAGVLLAGWTAL